MLIYLFSLITRNPVFGSTTRYEIDQTAQLQRKTRVLKTGYVVPSKQWTENEGADQTMQMQQADLRLWCSQRYKTGFLMARLYLFLLPPGLGKRGTCSPPYPNHPLSRHCWIMNDFFGGVRWVGCEVRGGGAWKFATPLYPYPTQSIYICVGVVAEGTGRLSRILHG